MMIQSKVILQGYNKPNLKKIVVNGSGMVLEMLDSLEKLAAKWARHSKARLWLNLWLTRAPFNPTAAEMTKVGSGSRHCARVEYAGKALTPQTHIIEHSSLPRSSKSLCQLVFVISLPPARQSHLEFRSRFYSWDT
jgi:hypothetical protein